MVYCAALGCGNRSEKGVRMYGFPTDTERRKKWLALLNRSNFTMTKQYNNTKICEAHFEADQFVKTKKGKTRLRAEAIPTIFLHRPMVKKRRPPVQRCTIEPVNTQCIAADHSYSIGGDKALKTEERSQASESDLLKKLKRQEQVTRTAMAALRKIRKENHTLKRTLRKLKDTFSKDQLQALGKLTAKGMKWNSDTIIRALKIYFAAGPTGYKTIKELHVPLPRIRTLQQRMQCVKFEPGVLTEVFEFLKLKVDGLTELERGCVLTLDKIAITPSVELNMITGKLYGHVTLPGYSGVATHACVFMLAGSTTLWKQVVAYHYSDNSTSGAEYKPVIIEIIQRAASIGLHVLNVTTDMGNPNKAMWKSFGVDHNKISVPHPAAPDRQLYFMPDVPCLVKNLECALVHGQEFIIPEDIVCKENLLSNSASVVPIMDLLTFQEGMALKIAPLLSAAAMEPNHFDKMKEGPALNVFNKATSVGLKYMVEQENRPPSYMTTAWLLEQVDHWIDLMSSHHPVTALSRLQIEEYQKAITFLQNIIHLFRGMKIGPKGVWKPIQTGVIMATTSILAIQEEMLTQGHRFVLTSRFTQDCLEKTFSCVSSRNTVPTPVEFQHALRIISVGQFLTNSKSESYQEENTSFWSDFLDTVGQNVTPSIRVEQLMVYRAAHDLTKADKCILFHLAGYIVHKVIRFASICEKCKIATKHNNDSPGDNNILPNLNKFKAGALCHSSPEACDFIYQIEKLVRNKSKSFLMDPNAVSILEKEARTLSSRLPSCCGVQEKMLKRFIHLRLRIETSTIQNDRKKN